MVATDCEINEQSYIPYCAPVDHCVPKAHRLAQLSLWGHCLEFHQHTKAFVLTLSHLCLTLYLTQPQSKCNQDCKIVLTGTTYPNKSRLFFFFYRASSWQLRSRMFSQLKVVPLWKMQVGYLDKANFFTGPSRNVIYLPKHRQHSLCSRSWKLASLSLPLSVFISLFEEKGRLKHQQGCR